MVAAAVVALAPHPDVAAADWIPLGGPYDDSTPQVSPTGNFVMQTGLDNGSYAHLRTGGFWSGPLDLGGQFQSVVTPTVELNGPQPSPAEWFGIGLDSAMWHRTQNTGWQSLRRAVHRQPRGDPLRRRDLRVRDRLGRSRVVSDVGVGVGQPRWPDHLEPRDHDRWNEHVPHRSRRGRRHVGPPVLGMGMVGLELARRPADLVPRGRVPVRRVVRLRYRRGRCRLVRAAAGRRVDGVDVVGRGRDSAPAATGDPMGGVECSCWGSTDRCSRGGSRPPASRRGLARRDFLSYPGAGGT